MSADAPFVFLLFFIFLRCVVRPRTLTFLVLDMESAFDV